MSEVRLTFSHNPYVKDRDVWNVFWGKTFVGTYDASSRRVTLEDDVSDELLTFVLEMEVQRVFGTSPVEID